jgi:hypothetical protein
MGNAERKDADMSTRPQTFKDPTRKTAFVAGVLYLATFLSSIPAVFLLGSALTDPNYITGAGPDGFVRLGAFLDLINCATLVGTAVALYSVTKRHHEGFALGFVTTRSAEAAILVVATLAILAVVTLREAGIAGADSTSLVAVGRSLVAVRDWAFVIGTGVAALNALMLATVMYRSGLVPRPIPALGLIGVVTFGSWVIGYILGVADLGTPWQAVGVAPIFVWELALGLWMTFKGFNRHAVARLYPRTEASTADAEVATSAIAAMKAGVA